MEKQICIYKDENYEKEMTNAFTLATEKATTALFIYETLTGEKLNPEQWDKFLSNPSQLVTEVVHAKTQVPPGMDKSQWLKLIELPDCTELTHLLSDTFVLVAFLQFDGKTVALTDIAKKTITGKNHYVSESKAETFKVAMAFVKALNKLRKHKPEATDQIISNRNSLVTQDWNTKEYEIDINKFMHNFGW